MKKISKMPTRRKEFTQQFYLHNKGAFLLSVAATILLGCSNLLISWIMQQIIDSISGNTQYGILRITYIFIIIVAATFFVLMIEYYSCPRFIKKAIIQYKDFAFQKIAQKSIHSFHTENTSTYLSALSNDVLSIENNYLLKIFTLIKESVMFVGAFALMLYYSPILTLVAFLLSLLPVIASLLTGNRLAIQEKEVSDKNESFIGAVKDILTGFSVIKSFKAEIEVIRLFAERNTSTEEAKCRRRMTETMIMIIGFMAGLTAQFGVFLFGSYLALTQQSITAGIVIVFVQLMNYVITPIADVPQILANRKAANALIDKLADAVHSNIQRDGKQINKQLNRAIELKDLSFSYEKSTPILDHIDMRFEAGKSYAVVGASGSGKSTLLNLLIGSREDYEGEILFDGNELRTLSLDSLYDLVSIVQQNVFVFNSSVQNNITMFRNFDEEKLHHAIAMSGLSPFIEERGSSYECGENGNGLSGGERQRISIARCLLRGTPVMLVDEATAALDAETAFSVTNSILSISGLTRIIVTHRLEEALLRKYDEILVLRNGKVEEHGTFAELMDKKEYFYSLFTVSQ